MLSGIFVEPSVGEYLSAIFTISVWSRNRLAARLAAFTISSRRASVRLSDKPSSTLNLDLVRSDLCVKQIVETIKPGVDALGDLSFRANDSHASYL
jgi:hypothetical protein